MSIDTQILEWSRQYNFTRDGVNHLKMDEVDNDPRYIKMTLIDNWNKTLEQICTILSVNIDILKTQLEVWKQKEELMHFEGKNLFLTKLGTSQLTLESMIDMMNTIKSERNGNERIRKFIEWGGRNNIPLWSSGEFVFDHTAYAKGVLGFRIGHLTMMPRLIYTLISNDYESIILLSSQTQVANA